MKKRVSFGKERFVFDAGGTPRQLPARTPWPARSNKQPACPLKKGHPMAPLDNYKPQIVLADVPLAPIMATSPVLVALCSQPLFPFPVPSRSIPQLATPLSPISPRAPPSPPSSPPCPPSPPGPPCSPLCPPGPAVAVVAALRRGQAPVALPRAEHEKEEEEGGTPCSKTKSTEGNEGNGGSVDGSVGGSVSGGVGGIERPVTGAERVKSGFSALHKWAAKAGKKRL